MDLIVSRKFLKFVSENKQELTKLSCTKFRQLGNKWECIIPIQSNKILGIQVFNIKLPNVNTVKIDGHGLHTKILMNSNMIDHFEIGGPLKINLEYMFKIKGVTTRDNVIRIVLPDTNVNQKVLSVKSNFTFDETVDEEGNRVALIWLPRRALTKGLDIKFDISMETSGFDVYHRCLGKPCRPIIEKKVELDHHDNELDLLISKTSSESNMINIVTGVFKYLQKRVKYRVNYEKFGWTYALKMGFGACDEISDFTVKILRSMGIKAKYVKGFHIKNENFIRGHAWVEVSTDIGDVPIDPTAKIFGIGMPWVKILATNKPSRSIIELPKGVKLLNSTVKLI